jgi:hypothetical protein
VNIYSIVQELDFRPLLGGGEGQGVLVASGIRGLVFEAGSLLGLAGIVYLLAPPGEIDDATVGEPAS